MKYYFMAQRCIKCGDWIVTYNGQVYMTGKQSIIDALSFVALEAKID